MRSSPTSTLETLVAAIEARRLVAFAYEGEPRIAEPHTLGEQGGALHLLAYQVGGRSASGPLPAWRRFALDKMSDVTPRDEGFAPRDAPTGRHASFDRRIAFVPDATLAWLLDPADPAVRAQALVDLAGKAPDDPEVREARREIPLRGAAARLLADLGPIPRDADALYKPKYGAAYHRLIALAEMGLDAASDPRASALLDACLDAFLGPVDGNILDDEVCVVGNLTRAAIRMGRRSDPRVARGLAWLVEAQMPDGGWHCWPEQAKGGTLDSWEALAAFAALPPHERPRETVARGVEFLLRERLGVDDPYEAWRRIHFPRHYYYDALLGLDLATQLGSPDDPRLAPALAWLRGKRGADGRWRLDAQHPDLAEGADYAPKHLAEIKPLMVEPLGEPSKWATLQAMRVLERAQGE